MNHFNFSIFTIYTIGYLIFSYPALRAIKEKTYSHNLLYFFFLGLLGAIGEAFQAVPEILKIPILSESLSDFGTIPGSIFLILSYRIRSVGKEESLFWIPKATLYSTTVFLSIEILSFIPKLKGVKPFGYPSWLDILAWVLSGSICYLIYLLGLKETQHEHSN